MAKTTKTQKADSEYKQCAVTKSIQATSRVSVKIKETYYTLEYTEERIIPDAYMPDFDLEKEKQLLWDAVNSEVDKQIEDVYNA